MSLLSPGGASAWSRSLPQRFDRSREEVGERAEEIAFAGAGVAVDALLPGADGAEHSCWGFGRPHEVRPTADSLQPALLKLVEAPAARDPRPRRRRHFVEHVRRWLLLLEQAHQFHAVDPLCCGRDSSGVLEEYHSGVPKPRRSGEPG